MRFSLLLYGLYLKLKAAARKNPVFQKYVSGVRLKVLIKTADGKQGRLFIFDRGKILSRGGAGASDFDVAIVWSDAATGYKVMLSASDEESFKAAAQGKLRVEGMAYYAQWFTEGVKLAVSRK